MIEDRKCILLSSILDPPSSTIVRSFPLGGETDLAVLLARDDLVCQRADFRRRHFDGVADF
jgi:hypothetical protein